MRLINTISLALEDYFEPDVPKYAILSHRWTKDEITYKDYTKGRRQSSLGYKKVLDFCKVALKRGHQYGWVDTVCIDKRSSAELSEAINSMWTWYQDSAECLVHLADVDFDRSICPGEKLTEDHLNTLRASDWFNRGWTLQELIAPRCALFFTATWRVFGRRASSPHMADESLVNLSQEISNITSIPEELLASRYPLEEYAIGVRAKWLAHRQLTRIEDQAYCALGLFGVNMPLLYGEGRRAWTRLQEEVIRTLHDESIFAWPSSPSSEPWIQPLLSATPTSFAELSTETGTVYAPRPLYSITNQGLRWDLHPRSALITKVAVPIPSTADAQLNSIEQRTALLVPIACMSEAPVTRQNPVLLIELACGHYMRVLGDRLLEFSTESMNYLLHQDPTQSPCQFGEDFTIYVHMRTWQSKACAFAYNQLSEHEALALAVISAFQKLFERGAAEAQAMRDTLWSTKDEHDPRTATSIPHISFPTSENINASPKERQILGSTRVERTSRRQMQMQMQLYDCQDPNCVRKGHYAFRRKDKMLMHMRSVHSKESPVGV